MRKPKLEELLAVMHFHESEETRALAAKRIVDIYDSHEALKEIYTDERFPHEIRAGAFKKLADILADKSEIASLKEMAHHPLIFRRFKELEVYAVRKRFEAIGKKEGPDGLIASSRRGHTELEKTMAGLEAVKLITNTSKLYDILMWNNSAYSFVPEFPEEVREAAGMKLVELAIEYVEFYGGWPYLGFGSSYKPQRLSKLYEDKRVPASVRDFAARRCITLRIGKGAKKSALEKYCRPQHCRPAEVYTVKVEVKFYWFAKPILESSLISREVKDYTAGLLLRRLSERKEDEEALFGLAKGGISQELSLAAALKLVGSLKKRRDYAGLQKLAFEDGFPKEALYAAASAVIDSARKRHDYSGLQEIFCKSDLPEFIRERAGLLLIEDYSAKGDYEKLLTLAGSDSTLVRTVAEDLTGNVALTKAYALALQGDYAAVHGIASDSRLPEPIREEVGQVVQYAAAVRIEQLAVKGDYDALSAMAKEGVVPESMRALASSVVEIAEARKIGEAARSGSCDALARVAADEKATGIARMVADQHLRQRVCEIAQRL